MRKGILITFEGTEGAGKSTLIREISRLLKQKKIPHITTREPGGEKVAEKIRALILDHPMAPLTELFLYEAARSEHLVNRILPALKTGKIVLCDRFTDSSLAYQGHARGLPWADVKRLNEIATQGIKPTLTLLLDVDPKAGLERAQVQTRFEKEGVKFQTKVRQGFLKSMREEPRRWMRLTMKKNGQWVPAKILAEQVLHEIEKRRKK